MCEKFSSFGVYGCLEKKSSEHNTQIQFIRPIVHALKSEHDRYRVSYMFRHFLCVIIREFLYQSKVVLFELVRNVSYCHSLAHIIKLHENPKKYQIT